MPGESLLTATPLTGATLPTAVICPCQFCMVDTAELTDSGGGPDFSNCLPMAMSEEICENLMKPSAPTRSSRPSTTSTTRPARRGLETGTDTERGLVVVTVLLGECMR